MTVAGRTPLVARAGHTIGARLAGRAWVSATGGRKGGGAAEHTRTSVSVPSPSPLCAQGSSASSILECSREAQASILGNSPIHPPWHLIECLATESASNNKPMRDIPISILPTVACHATVITVPPLLALHRSRAPLALFLCAHTHALARHDWPGRTRPRCAGKTRARCAAPTHARTHPPISPRCGAPCRA
jgi:hypothetical protein